VSWAGRATALGSINNQHQRRYMMQCIGVSDLGFPIS
jgi:hypothetical protein